MKRWGIRGQVLFIALAPAAVIGAVLAAYFTHVQVRGLDQALGDRGRGLVRQLAPAAEYGVVTANGDILRALAAAALREPDVIAVRFDGPDGSALLAVARPDAQASADAITFRVPILPSELAVSDFADQGPLPGAAPVGWTAVDLSREATHAAQRQAIASGAGITVLGLALAALLALRIGSGVSRPIRRLTVAVQAIGAGGLGTRVGGESGAKLQILATGINRMAEGLEAARDDLQASVERASDALRGATGELEAARAREGEAGRIKTGFLTSVSREIRAPLTNITSLAALLLKTRLDEEQLDYAHTVRDSIDALLMRLDDILDFSCIAAGELTLRQVAFNLRDVVDEAVAISARAAYDSNLELGLLFYSDVPERLVGDPVRIRQVLMTLLSNAIKFTQRGRITVRVMLDDQDPVRAQLRISVQDTGVGLSREAQETLFARPGGGLGLVVCRTLVERMDGTMGFESRQGAGSTFWFTCRCALQRHAIAPAPLELAGRRALLLEPDELRAAALSAQLQTWGMEVEAASDLDQARRLLERHPPTPDLTVALIVGIGRDHLGEQPLGELIEAAARLPACALMVLASTLNRRLLQGFERRGALVALPKVARRGELYEGLRRLLRHPPSQQPPRANPDLSHLRVLVVDDHAISRRVIAALYGPTGAQVDEAASGEEAVRMAAAGAYDLIYMDIRLPGISGVEAAAEIRAACKPHAAPPLIAVTASTAQGECRRLLEAGLDDCVVKPVSERDVQALTRRWAPSQRPDPARCGPHRTRPAGGDAAPDPAGELEAMLVAELPATRVRLHDCIERGDLQRLEAEAHKLHGAACYCSAASLRTAAAALERAAREADAEGLRASSRDVDEAIEALLTRAGTPPN